LDSTAALSDGDIPANSNDKNVLRFTWWPHKGTAEWVQYDFQKPRKVSQAEVYWFDDTGGGGGRVPQSWKLLYKDGDNWKEVPNASACGVEKDKFNKVTFDAVNTAALRLEAKLQQDYSAGILEWQVE